MEFKITRVTAESSLPVNKLKFELLARKKYKTIALFSVMTIALCIPAITESKDLINGYSMGAFVCLLIVIGHIYQITIGKEKFLDAIKKSITPENSETTLTINQEMITYRDRQSYFEFKWSYFSSYLLHERYLFIIPGGNLLSAISVSKQEVTPDQFLELNSFVSAKFPQWK